MSNLRILACICCFVFVSCRTVPKNFIQHTQGLRHLPTALLFPEEVNNWQRSGEIKENLNPEILAATSYVYMSDAKDFKPQATVYLLKHPSTANVKLIENITLVDLIGSEFVANETVKLKNKNKINVNIYNHTADIKSTYTHISVNKEIKNQSLFAQSAKKLQVVFLLTINREVAEEKKLALQFVDDFLVAN